jgi:hypothetical protein
MAGSGKIEMAKRLARVEDMLCSGASPSSIVRTLSGPPVLNDEGQNVGGYAISTRMVKKYITKVYLGWAEQELADRPHRQDKIRHMGERLYLRAAAQGKLAVAATVLDKLARMEGMYLDRLELAGAGGGPLRVSIEDARAQLREKIERLARQKKGE